MSMYLWFGAAIMLAFLLGTFGGFVVGYSLQRCRQLVDELKAAIDQHAADHAEAERPEPAVVDDREVAKQRKARRDRGEDEPASDQIISTKTPAQRQAETDAAREARLDKWMPGVKRASS